MRAAILAALPLLVALFAGSAAPAQEARPIDDFSDPALWRGDASDGVAASASPFEGGLRLDYDFSRGSGYAFLRRDLPLELPENFELRFRLRGEGAPNALELKLVDASGDNVWWHRRADYVPPSQWTTIRVRRRQIDFAWGPTEDRTLRGAAAIEFVVAAGSGGGRGWIAVDDLEIVPLPLPPAVPPAIVASATAGGGAEFAVDGHPGTAWTAPADAALVLDLGYLREFGGLVLRWAADAHASSYEIALSADGRSWTTALTVEGGNGSTDWLRMEESEARFIRLQARGGGAGGVIALAEAEVRPLAFGASANGFVAAVAAEAPRGTFPRGFVGEQNYWTLVATPAGGESGLIDEDGAIEVGRGGFSIEPFVFDGARSTGWADAASAQSLRDGDLPIPTVERRGDGWRLAVTAIAERDRVVARYRLRNEGAEPRLLGLDLAVRPFQVNPPQQFLNIVGGVSPIRTLAWRDGAMHVDGTARVRPASAPDAVQVLAFDAAAAAGPLPAAVEDPNGLASGLLVHRRHLSPGEEMEVALSLGLAGPARPLAPSEARRIEDEAAAAWRGRLDLVSLSGPPAAEPVFATLRSALAQILMTREGPALRPGSRAYARSWIRDGAMMATALLRLGHAQPAIDFLSWYAPHQYETGKVPCCVDARGADPVPEHDSDGQLIHLIAQLHRYAPDRPRLELMWPRVLAAAGHIETLRQSTRMAANRDGATRHFFGLLPPSISHEGYSAKPMHSYWDDFWALLGLEDAAWIAAWLGRTADERRLRTAAEEFRGDILRSLAAAREIHGIDFLPGAADLGDFDATSTTIALSPAGEQHRLPQDALTATFERYWREFAARRDGGREWDAYTPYEWRNVGAFVRLGWDERARELVDFFMADRRPAGWNQWAEVVARRPREPRFLGDMPHGWVASDFINAALDMLVYERSSDRALVLAAGVPRDWLRQGGIAVERLRTPYGLLSFTLRAEGERGSLGYALDGAPPPGGLVLGLAGAGLPLAGSRGRIAFDLP